MTPRARKPRSKPIRVYDTSLFGIKLSLDPRRKFEMTGNPIYVWEAFKFYRSMKKQIPEWIMEYLDHAASKLLQHAQHEPAKGEASIAIAAAMDMNRGGQGNVFTQYAANEKNESDHRILQAVSDRIKAGEKPKHAFEFAAKDCGVSASTARRMWLKFISSPSK
jgi:hypothetical protein